MEERPPKPAELADRRMDAQGAESAAASRAWWRRVPRVLTHPVGVFEALREDDEIDVEARSEPIFAIVVLAGMAGVLLAPRWGTLLDEESLDWIVIAVLTFIGGLLYGVFGYFLLGFCVWLGARGVGVDARAREARQVVGFALLPLALSFFITVPVTSVAFGYDWYRTGGSDSGVGRAMVVAAGLGFAAWSLSLLAVGLRARFRLPWRGVAGAIALAAVLIAAVGVVPTVL